MELINDRDNPGEGYILTSVRSDQIAALNALVRSHIVGALKKAYTEQTSTDSLGNGEPAEPEENNQSPIFSPQIQELFRMGVEYAGPIWERQPMIDKEYLMGLSPRDDQKLYGVAVTDNIPESELPVYFFLLEQERKHAVAYCGKQGYDSHLNRLQKERGWSKLAEVPVTNVRGNLANILKQMTDVAFNMNHPGCMGIFLGYDHNKALHRIEMKYNLS
ncbi:hypothetical protein ACFL0W_04590 [Nanoarchaeota archaeon]